MKQLRDNTGDKAENKRTLKEYGLGEKTDKSGQPEAELHLPPPVQPLITVGSITNVLNSIFYCMALND